MSLFILTTHAITPSPHRWPSWTIYGPCLTTKTRDQNLLPQWMVKEEHTSDKVTLDPVCWPQTIFLYTNVIFWNILDSVVYIPKSSVHTNSIYCPEMGLDSYRLLFQGLQKSDEKWYVYSFSPLGIHIHPLVVAFYLHDQQHSIS